MSITKRHHFIPVFYLKHFTNEDGFFYIYNVKKDSFKNKGRKFHPKTQFYEHFGNTTYYVEEESDFIENSFNNWDNQVANIYQKIINSDFSENHVLSDNEWIMLQYFVNVLFWRNPSNINKVKEYILNATSISDFRMKMIDNVTGEKVGHNDEMELLQKIKDDNEFHKFLKLMLPSITYPEVFKKSENNFAHIFTLPYNLPKLVSDNPIIYRNLPNEGLHTDDFIFPLTPQKILIRNKMKGLLIYSQVRILIDMLLLMQAREYVSSTDLKYPILLKEQFNKSFSSIEGLRNEIFNNIFLKIG